jgi:hypothetical protein
MNIKNLYKLKFELISTTVKARYNEHLVITNLSGIPFQKSYTVKLKYVRYSEPRYNELFDITNHIYLH